MKDNLKVKKLIECVLLNEVMLIFMKEIIVIKIFQKNILKEFPFFIKYFYIFISILIYYTQLIYLDFNYS